MNNKNEYKYSRMVEKIVGKVTFIRLKKEIDDMIIRLNEESKKENDRLLRENLNLRYENRYLYARLTNNKNIF